jgi:hemerythrin
MTMGWSPSLALGIPEIDAQHQELFRRLGALLHAMEIGSRDEIGTLFEFLAAYVAEHFGAEERLMQECAFPGFTVHKAAHDRFVREYQALRKLFDENGPTQAVAIKAKTWLVDWLTGHITGTDQLLAGHLLKRAG